MKYGQDWTYSCSDGGNGEGKRWNELSERVKEEPRAKKFINNETSAN